MIVLFRSDRSGGSQPSYRCRAVVAIAIVLGAAVRIAAHDFSASDSLLTIDGSIVRSTLSLNLLEMGGVDVNDDQRVSYDELDRAIERVFASITDHYRINAAGESSPSVNADRSEIVDDHVLQIELRYAFSRPVTTIEITSTLDQILGSTHQHVVSLKVGSAFRREVLDAQNHTAHFDTRRITVDRIAAVVLAVLGLLALGVYRHRTARTQNDRVQ